MDYLLYSSSMRMFSSKSQHHVTWQRLKNLRKKRNNTRSLERDFMQNFAWHFHFVWSIRTTDSGYDEFRFFHNLLPSRVKWQPTISRLLKQTKTKKNKNCLELTKQYIFWLLFWKNRFTWLRCTIVEWYCEIFHFILQNKLISCCYRDF